MEVRREAFVTNGRAFAKALSSATIANYEVQIFRIEFEVVYFSMASATQNAMIKKLFIATI